MMTYSLLPFRMYVSSDCTAISMKQYILQNMHHKATLEDLYLLLQVRFDDKYSIVYRPLVLLIFASIRELVITEPLLPSMRITIHYSTTMNLPRNNVRISIFCVMIEAIFYLTLYVVYTSHYSLDLSKPQGGSFSIQTLIPLPLLWEERGL